MKNPMTLSRRRAEKQISILRQCDAEMVSLAPFAGHGNYHVRNKALRLMGQPTEKSAAQLARAEAETKKAAKRTASLLNDGKAT